MSPDEERAYYHAQQAKGLCTRKHCNRPLSPDSTYLCAKHLEIARSGWRYSGEYEAVGVRPQIIKDRSSYIGQKFNLLTVIGLAEREYYTRCNGKTWLKNQEFICQCDCGRLIKVDMYRLIYKRAYSCGCTQRPTSRSRRPRLPRF